MIKSKISIILVLLVLVMPLVLSYEIPIIIKTYPNSEVTFRVLDRATGRMVDPIGGVFVQNADSIGEVKINYTSFEPLIKGSIAIKQGSNEVKFVNDSLYFIYNKYKTEGINRVILVPYPNNPTVNYEPFEVEEEIVEEVQEEVTNEATEDIGGEKTVTDEVQEEIVEDGEVAVTGSVIENTKNFFSGKVLYFAIGIVVLVALFFLITGVRKSFKKSDNIKVRKWGDRQDEELDDAEKKLNEAKQELEDIRNKKSKINEAKEKLRKDREELSKLEREQDNTPSNNQNNNQNPSY
ncbi:MAG: hypothetical protein ABIH37_03620 [archaeon]